MWGFDIMWGFDMMWGFDVMWGFDIMWGFDLMWGFDMRIILGLFGLSINVETALFPLLRLLFVTLKIEVEYSFGSLAELNGADDSTNTAKLEANHKNNILIN